MLHYFENKQALIRATLEILADRFRDRLEGRWTAGLIRPEVDPRQAAMQLSGLTDGLVVQILLEPQQRGLPRQAVRAVDDLIDNWLVPAAAASTSRAPGVRPAKTSTPSVDRRRTASG